MYKSGQTPDDVYFSPARETSGYVAVDERSDDEYVGDRYLRMKSSNRTRWSRFDDDFMYWNDPRWNNQFYFNSFYSPYSRYNPWLSMGWGTGFHPGYYPYSGVGFGVNYWNGFYNPFFPGYYGAPVVIVTKPVTPRAYAPRSGNLSSYNLNRNSFMTDPKTGNRVYNMSTYRRTNSANRSGGNYYSPSQRNTRLGSFGESRSSSPSRSFNNVGNNNRNSSSGSGRSSGSSSGGSAPVRTFKRGG